MRARARVSVLQFRDPSHRGASKTSAPSRPARAVRLTIKQRWDRIIAYGSDWVKWLLPIIGQERYLKQVCGCVRLRCVSTRGRAQSRLRGRRTPEQMLSWFVARVREWRAAPGSAESVEERVGCPPGATSVLKREHARGPGGKCQARRGRWAQVLPRRGVAPRGGHHLQDK